MSPWNNAILENSIKFSNCLFFIFSMDNWPAKGYADRCFLVRSFLSPLQSPSLPWLLAFAVRRPFSCVCFFPHHSSFPIIFVASLFSTSVWSLPFGFPSALFGFARLFSDRYSGFDLRLLPQACKPVCGCGSECSELDTLSKSGCPDSVFSYKVVLQT